MLRRGIAALALVAAASSCGREGGGRAPGPDDAFVKAKAPRPSMPWASGEPLGDGETYAFLPDGARRETIETARAAGLLDVDLSDEWAPFIFSERDGTAHDVDDVPKPNAYRATFVALANNRTTTDELFLDSADGRRAVLAAAGVAPARKGQPPSRQERRALGAARRALSAERSRNFLEVFGIPPTLSVLRARLDEDRGRTCYATIDNAGLAGFTDEVVYLSHDQARRQQGEALGDEAWRRAVEVARLRLVGPPLPDGADPRVTARLERHRRGQARLRAIRSVQARLRCEGLLSPASRFTEGMFDLQTHKALALWERKNDIFGWGFISAETVAALQRPPLELHLDTLKRILGERVADAAGIIEDGSAVVAKGKRPATYRDESGADQAVPDLIGAHVEAVLRVFGIVDADDMAAWMQGLPAQRARFHVAIAAPPLPPYYGQQMDLTAEIDRGDVWYDFPWDEIGSPIEQRRQRFPSLTVFVKWNNQRIPLARWRTTIGSWRSELHADGKIYYKYKNSDVGPRIWKNIVAAPVWVPPDGTPGKDLLTKKVFDRQVGSVPVVDTDVMGPGFQSAYGLVMAIHLKAIHGGGVFDNQIRTHGSVDYTSIARRFSHGCHRLVNNRAVRLFGFVLRHRPYKRLGQMPLGPMKKRFDVDGTQFGFTLSTRGYYYELDPPMPVMVTEGRIMGKVAKPIVTYMRKPGVDYGDQIETATAVGP